MFFSTYVLTKKGPLAKIWLAAHWDRRLTRHEVKVVDLRQTIVHIVQPVVPIALRTSGELLVGVVRIYALKMKHLLKDATDATLLLRVTTVVPSKGQFVPHGTEDTATAIHSAGAKTLLDGVLIHGAGGDMEAVTFDWSADATAAGVTAGVGPRDTTDALCEARFDEIADLLKGRHAVPRSAYAHDALAGEKERYEADAMLASAWYALEPAMQSTEELHGTQRDYDEIARLRADLMAAGEDGRATSGSGSGSKKSLSNPSIEKGRHSAQHMFFMPQHQQLQQQQQTKNNQEFLGDFPAPALADEFDIGAPLPEDHELPAFLLPNARDDLFAIPDTHAAAFTAPIQSDANNNNGNDNNNNNLPKGGRRNARSLGAGGGVVVDTAATTLPRETFERWMTERWDTIDTEPRRGPFDAQEARDRTCLAPDPPIHTSSSSTARRTTTTTTTTTGGGQGEGHAQLLWNIVDSSPMWCQMSETLGAAYAAAIAPSIEKALSAHRRQPPQQQQDQQQDQQQQQQQYNDEEALAAMGGEVLDLPEEGPASRKRAREEETNEMDEANRADPSGSGLSLGAIAMLRRIRDEIARGLDASRKQKGRKAQRPAEVCTLHEVCRHMHRREAARAFVDVLALASKQMLSVRQESAAGEVELSLTEAAGAVLVS